MKANSNYCLQGQVLLRSVLITILHFSVSIRFRFVFDNLRTAPLPSQTNLPYFVRGEGEAVHRLLLTLRYFPLLRSVY